MKFFELINNRNCSTVGSSDKNSLKSNYVSNMKSESSNTTWDLDDLHLGGPSAPEQSKASMIDCFLYWTGSIYQTESIAKWRAHFTAHLEGQRLQSTIECSFCHDFTATSTGTSSAWEQTLDHISAEPPRDKSAQYSQAV
jgi:hypothetical protein